MQLRRAAVEPIARLVLDEPAAIVEDFTVHSIDYDAYLPGRTLTRVEGRATVGGRERRWSVIRKWTDAAADTPTAPTEGARREALAYRSSFADAVAGFRMPTAFAIDVTDDDGPVEIWLEDVTDDREKWSLDTFAAAARALGRFNGTWHLRGIADHGWLVADWAQRQSEPVDMPSARAEISALAATSAVRDAIGRDAGSRVTKMVEDQASFIDALARLPQTLCHHDAARSNVIVRALAPGTPEVVAIDWESVGPGPLGAEIATLVSGSVRKGDFPATDVRALDETVFTAYLEGLRDVGWDGDTRVVRVGYAMSLALRCWLVRDTLRNLADADARPSFGRATHVEPSGVVAAFSSLSRFLLDRADEARHVGNIAFE
jgi:hypothetical protein